MSALRRWTPAIATATLPYLVVFLVYVPSVRQVLGPVDWGVLGKIGAEHDDEIARLVGLVSGSFSVGVAEAFLRIAGFASLILAGVVLARLFPRRGLAAAAGVAIVFFTVSALDWYFPRSLPGPVGPTGYLRPVLEHAFLATAGNGAPVVAERTIRLTIALNLCALMVGFNSLLAAFAGVALTGPESTPQRLKLRLDSLISLTLVGATLLVCTTAVNKALAGWPHGLIAASSQKSFADLGTAIGNFWGAFGTIVLLCALLPPLLCIKSDVSAAAAGAAGADGGAQAAWRKTNGLDLDLKTGVGAALATIAPILTSPGIDLLGKMFS